MNGYSGTSFWGGGQYDATQDWLSAFNARNGFDPTNRDMNAGRSNAFYSLLQSGGGMDPRSWYARAGDLADQQSGMAAGLSKALAASPEQRSAALMAVLPGLEDIASRIRAGADSDMGSSSADAAKAASSTARRQVEGSLSRSGALGAVKSGGAGRMVVDAAQEPLLNAVMRLSELRSQSYQNAINPLVQGARAEIGNRANEYGNGLSALSGALSPLLSAGNGLAGLLADQSQQAILAPQVMQRTGFGEQLGTSLLSGALGGLSSGLFGGLGGGLSSAIAALFQPKAAAPYTPMGAWSPQGAFDINDPASWSRNFNTPYSMNYDGGLRI